MFLFFTGFSGKLFAEQKTQDSSFSLTLSYANSKEASNKLIELCQRYDPPVTHLYFEIESLELMRFHFTGVVLPLIDVAYLNLPIEIYTHSEPYLTILFRACPNIKGVYVFTLSGLFLHSAIRPHTAIVA